MVCVQGLLVWRAREGEDLTWDKSDPKDAMLIARLTTQLRCYEPETATTRGRVCVSSARVAPAC